MTFLVRLQMRNVQEGATGLRRQVLQQFGERLQAPAEAPMPTTGNIGPSGWPSSKSSSNDGSGSAGRGVACGGADSAGTSDETGLVSSISISVQSSIMTKRKAAGGTIHCTPFRAR